MAIVTDHFEITVKLVDEGARHSTKTYQCQDAAYADVIIAKTALVAALAGVTNCVIQRISVNEVWKNDAFAYPADVKVGDKASLTIELEGGIGKKANIKIPGPVDAMFGAQGTSGFNEVDTANVALGTYVDMFENGAEFYVSDGEFFETLIKGKRISAALDYTS